MFAAPPDATPVVIEARRRQTFSWPRAEEVPLEDFHEADRAFIGTEPLRYLARAP